MSGLESGTRYRIRERSFSPGHDLWIETADGERAFEVNGAVFDDSGISVVRTPDGADELTIRPDDPETRSTVGIERRGERVATVEKRIAGLHRRYTVVTEAGDSLVVEGDLLAREFAFTREGNPVAEVADRWFEIHHALGVDIAPGEDDALILAAILCVDWMGRG
jgi:uncharacterized protein YxjI